MNTNTLQAVQDTLEKRGVKDVKFLFRREALAMPMSDLEEDVADVMAKFYAGKKTVVEKLPSEELSQI